MNEFQPPDMACDHCAGSGARAPQQADPVCMIEIDLKAQTVRVPGCGMAWCASNPAPAPAWTARVVSRASCFARRARRWTTASTHPASSRPPGRPN